MLVVTAAADKAVVTAPTSVTHQLWAAVLSVTTFFLVLATHPCWLQVSSAADSMMFMTKAIMKRSFLM